MKKISFLILSILAVLFTSSCSSISEELGTENTEKVVTLDLQGDFTFEPFTRAAAGSDNCEDIFIFDYFDGSLTQVIHQHIGDANFGKPDMSLKFGKHDMYFVVSGGSEPTVNGNIITWKTIGDTFWCKATTEVDMSSSSRLSVVLNRVVTMFKIRSIDSVPNNSKYVKIAPTTWYCGIDYTTGKHASVTHDKEFTYYPNNVGGATEIELYGFLNGEDLTTRINVYAWSTDNVISKLNQFTSVPFKTNRVTSMSCVMFTGSNNYQYSLDMNTNWLTELKM